MPRTPAIRPMWIGGFVVMLLVGCAGGESSEEAAIENFEQKLMIDIDGTTVALPLDAMDVWLTDDPARPEYFEIHGDGIAIVGTLPRNLRIDYAENWHVLMGQSVPLSARGGDPQYDRPSVLTVPGIGQFRVVGGQFTVDDVQPGRNGLTPLTGRIELRVRAARGQKSLNGTFAVKAMTWS